MPDTPIRAAAEGMPAEENPYDAARRLSHELVAVLDRFPETGRAVVITTDPKFPVMVVLDRQYSAMMGRLNAYKARHDAMRADPSDEARRACDVAHAALVASFSDEVSTGGRI